MKTSNPVILSLLSDARIQALLSEQERAYWESSIGVTQNHGTSNSMSLPKITFLFTMFSFENPKEQDVVNLAYKLLKTFPIEDSNQRVEWNDLANLQLKDEYLSYYFLLASLALQLNKTISARLSLSDYQEQSYEESNWESRIFDGILRSLLYLIRKQGGFEDIRKAIESINKLQQEQASFESDYLSKFNSNQQTEEALWLVSLYHTSKAVVETAQYILQGYNYPGRKIDTIVRQHMDMAQKLSKTA